MTLMLLEDVLARYGFELEKDDVEFVKTTLEDETLSETDVRDLIGPLLQDKHEQWQDIVDSLAKRQDSKRLEEISLTTGQDSTIKNDIKKTSWLSKYSITDPSYKCSTDEVRPNATPMTTVFLTNCALF